MEDNIKEQLSKLTEKNFERMVELQGIERDLMLENEGTYNEIEELISKYNNIVEMRRGLNKEIDKEQDTINNVKGENLFGNYSNRYKRFGEFNTDKEVSLEFKEEN